jgi:peptide deformylase
MKLLYYPNISLDTYCAPVVEFNEELWNNLDHMLQIMDDNAGMGLAANQCGLDARLFIMRDLKGKLWEFINPEILFEDDVTYLPESCLSFPGLTLSIKRPKQVSIKAYNRQGEEFNIVAWDKEAVCISHEIQHLNGLTFLENLSRLEKRSIMKQWKKKK